MLFDMTFSKEITFLSELISTNKPLPSLSVDYLHTGCGFDRADAIRTFNVLRKQFVTFFKTIIFSLLNKKKWPCKLFYQLCSREQNRFRQVKNCKSCL